MSRVLNLYADRQYLAPGRPHLILLYPFWGSNAENSNDPVRGRFDRYQREGSRFFQLEPPERADVAVLPHEWIAGEKNALALALTDAMQQAGKQTAIFFNHDSEEQIDVPGSVIFRTSFTRSRRRANEYALPGWHEDILEKFFGGELPVREKGVKPVVGYCGYAASEGAARAERIVAPLRGQPGGYRVLNALGVGINDHVGMRLRSDAVLRLKQDRRVQTNFLLRDAFWNGWDGSLDHASAADAVRRSRQEFVENMIGSDYSLCVRGAGNFSYRFYETLSCGRIPVFLDTDCVLPYEEWIDWRRYCVWVPEANLPRIGEYIAAFHESLSPAEFQERQRSCRRLWEEWLSPTGYFANFHRYFR